MNTSFIRHRACEVIFARALSRTLALALALAAALLGVTSGRAAPKVGDTFPDLSASKLEGALPELKGKVVLVDFFASWCEPCNASFPVMEALHRQYSPRGLVIVAISVDENKADMDLFLKKHPATFAVVRDGGHKLVSAVKIKTMPSSFLLDTNGKVHAAHSGFRGEETRAQYVQEIESLLNPSPKAK